MITNSEFHVSIHYEKDADNFSKNTRNYVNATKF